MGAVQSIFKGIGAGFQKSSQAIGNVLQRVFTRADKPGLSLRQKEILAQYPTSNPRGRILLSPWARPPWPLEKWEPGSTFTAKDREPAAEPRRLPGIQLRGIKDKTGPAPRSNDNRGRKYHRRGLDFDRMRANTTLLVSQPTRVDGFGTIHPGEMTYQGPVKDAVANTAIGARFNFQRDEGGSGPGRRPAVWGGPKVTIKQATFALQAGIDAAQQRPLGTGGQTDLHPGSKPPLDIKAVIRADERHRQTGRGQQQPTGAAVAERGEPKSDVQRSLNNFGPTNEGLEERIAFSFERIRGFEKEAKAAEQQRWPRRRRRSRAKTITG